jgi:hypothetical protein
VLPAAQPPAHPASLAVGSGPAVIVNAPANVVVGAPMAMSDSVPIPVPRRASTVVPVAPNDVRTDPGVPGAPVSRAGTPIPVPPRRMTNPKVQSLQSALADLEIEDEFDIPAFLRRHNSTTQNNS